MRMLCVMVSTAPDDQPVGYLVKQLQHTIRLAIDRRLATVDLTLPQYTALVSLRAEPGLTNADLARRSFVTPQTMIRIVADHEARGWVTRRPDPAHGRRLLTDLTPEGRAAVTAGDDEVMAVEHAMLDGFSGDETAAFAAVLRRAVANVER